MPYSRPFRSIKSNYKMSQATRVSVLKKAHEQKIRMKTTKEVIQGLRKTKDGQDTGVGLFVLGWATD